jgi:xanthine dehydrogenase accessory factor
MGLPCGGRLELLVEELDGVKPLEELLASVHAGELTAREVDLDSGRVTLALAEPGVDFRVSGDLVVKTFGPAWQLMLIGDGQLARHLAGMARRLDYRVVICDPREHAGALEPLEGVAYTSAMPDDAVRSLGERAARTAVLALAHDPRQDDLGLMAALESEAFYIGALGSHRSAQARLLRLASLGYSDEQLARIHGPAGLCIGSKRPAEIALSMLAEITATRNGVLPDIVGVQTS